MSIKSITNRLPTAILCCWGAWPGVALQEHLVLVALLLVLLAETSAMTDPPSLCAKSQHSSSCLGSVRGYVLNMDQCQDRWDNMIKWWGAVWPDLAISRVSTSRTDVRGLGAGIGHIAALEMAVADGVDFALVLEDDALPFDVSRPDPQFSPNGSWAAVLGNLIAQLPSHSSVLLLGGHHIHPNPKWNTDSRYRAIWKSKGIVQIFRSFGAYAYIVSREQINPLLSLWKQHIEVENQDGYSIDIAWWKLWKISPAFLATPLMVDHASGFSHTHSEWAVREWEGVSEWWTIARDQVWSDMFRYSWPDVAYIEASDLTTGSGRRPSTYMSALNSWMEQWCKSCRASRSILGIHRAPTKQDLVKVAMAVHSKKSASQLLECLADYDHSSHLSVHPDNPYYKGSILRQFSGKSCLGPLTLPGLQNFLWLANTRGDGGGIRRQCPEISEWLAEEARSMEHNSVHCDAGFNIGASAAAALMGGRELNVVVHSFDIRPDDSSVSVLRGIFGKSRFVMHHGDILETVPLFAASGARCDSVFLDTGHPLDLQLFMRATAPKAKIFYSWTMRNSANRQIFLEMLERGTFVEESCLKVHCSIAADSCAPIVREYCYGRYVEGGHENDGRDKKWNPRIRRHHQSGELLDRRRKEGSLSTWMRLFPGIRLHDTRTNDSPYPLDRYLQQSGIDGTFHVTDFLGFNAYVFRRQDQGDQAGRYLDELTCAGLCNLIHVSLAENSDIVAEQLVSGSAVTASCMHDLFCRFGVNATLSHGSMALDYLALLRKVNSEGCGEESGHLAIIAEHLVGSNHGLCAEMAISAGLAELPSTADALFVEFSDGCQGDIAESSFKWNSRRALEPGSLSTIFLTLKGVKKILRTLFPFSGTMREALWGLLRSRRLEAYTSRRSACKRRLMSSKSKGPKGDKSLRVKAWANDGGRNVGNTRGSYQGHGEEGDALLASFKGSRLHRKVPSAPDLRIIIITHDRSQSLSRLLTSLANAEYGGDRVDLDVWIDPSGNVTKKEQVVEAAEGFNWRHGVKVVHLREEQAGIFAQWVYSWNASVPGGLKDSTAEKCLILEDDLQVSRFFWAWLKSAHAMYEKRDDIAGFTLQRASLCAANCENLAGGPAGAPTNFGYPVVGTWGFSPTAAHWVRFQAWAQNFRVRNRPPYVTVFDPILHDFRDISPSVWAKGFVKGGSCCFVRGAICSMWSIYHLRYTDTHRDRYIVYAKGPNGSTLACNHREPGLHYRVLEGPDHSLVNEWTQELVEFTSWPPTLNYAAMDTRLGVWEEDYHLSKNFHQSLASSFFYTQDAIKSRTGEHASVPRWEYSTKGSRATIHMRAFLMEPRNLSAEEKQRDRSLQLLMDLGFSEICHCPGAGPITNVSRPLWERLVEAHGIAQAEEQVIRTSRYLECLQSIIMSQVDNNFVVFESGLVPAKQLDIIIVSQMMSESIKEMPRSADILCLQYTSEACGQVRFSAEHPHLVRAVRPASCAAVVFSAKGARHVTRLFSPVFDSFDGMLAKLSWKSSIEVYLTRQPALFRTVRNEAWNRDAQVLEWPCRDMQMTERGRSRPGQVDPVRRHPKQLLSSQVPLLSGCEVRVFGGGSVEGDASYGAWQICMTRNLDWRGAMIYSFGVGEDTTFSEDLIQTLGVKTYEFDPTPKAKRHIEGALQRVPPGSMHFHGIALWSQDGSISLFPPLDPSHASYNMVPREESAPISVPAMTFSSVMQILGHDFVEVVKMDIEGWEYDVLAEMLRLEECSGLDASNFKGQGNCECFPGDLHLPFSQLLVEFHPQLRDGGDNLAEVMSQCLSLQGFHLAYKQDQEGWSGNTVFIRIEGSAK